MLTETGFERAPPDIAALDGVCDMLLVVLVWWTGRRDFKTYEESPRLLDPDRPRGATARRRALERFDQRPPSRSGVLIRSKDFPSAM